MGSLRIWRRIGAFAAALTGASLMQFAGTAPAATPVTLPITSVDAVGSEVGHYAAAAVDGNPATRWESCGDGAALTIGLPHAETVQRVRIAFSLATQRSYRFEVRVTTSR